MRKTVNVMGMQWTIISKNERETIQNGRTFFACRCKPGRPWMIMETVEVKDGLTEGGVTIPCHAIVAEHREGYPDTKALTAKVLQLIAVSVDSQHAEEPWIATDGDRFQSDTIITTQDLLENGLVPICEIETDFAGEFGVKQKSSARRIVACVNKCAGMDIEVLEAEGVILRGDHESQMALLRHERDQSTARIDWLERVNTLHRQVEILYVVNGYNITITWDCAPISEDFHGETVAEAIDKAMAGFDLDVQPQHIAAIAAAKGGAE